MTRMKSLGFAVLSICVLASEASAQYCPSHDDGPPKFISDKRPPPRGAGQCLAGGGGPSTEGGGGGPPPGGASPTGSKAECAGDPVAIFGTHSYSFDRIEDFMVQTPIGQVSFQRSYVSSDLPWRGGRTSETPATLAGVPKPFGASRVEGDTSQRWSHNFFAFVDARPSNEWRVRPPRGTEELFGTCSSLPCWAPRGISPGEPSRLFRRSDGSFLFVENDGRQFVFGAATADAGMYFLTEVRAGDGRLISTVSYARPSSCPGFMGLSDGGVPYVSTIDNTGAPSISLNYSQLGSECVVTGASVGGTAVTSYVYQDGIPGHLVGATTPQFVEGYTNYQQGWVVSRDAGLITHAADAGTALNPSHGAQNDQTVVTLADFHDVMSIAGPLAYGAAFPDGGSVCGVSGGCCSGAFSRRVDVTSAGRGDGQAGNSSLAQTYFFSASGGSTEGHRPEVRVDQCAPGDYSCSPGHVRWWWIGANNSGSSSAPWQACGQPGVTSHMMAVKDKRGSWTVTPVEVLDAGGGQQSFAQVALLRGVPTNTSYSEDPDGGANDINALERTYYTYTFIGGVQYLATEKRPSALTGGWVTKTYVRDSNGRLTGTFVDGSTSLMDGTVQQRTVARFTQYDSLGRIAVEEGPCIVASTSATSCSGSGPRTEREYYANGNGNSSGQLRYLKRFIDSTNALTTQFANYTSLGDAQTVIDENLVETRFTYQGHLVTRTEVEIGAVDWVTDFTWENEKLTAIKYPEGNYETFCYRSVTTADGACVGSWTGRLQRVRRGASAGGASDWSEAIVYTYRSDGTLSSESTFLNGVTAARVTKNYAADAHKRPTWERTGSATTGYAEVRGFDGADSLEAIGRPYNTAPAYCRTGTGALSMLCSQMIHDRADRVRQLDVYPTGSGTPERACIDYDLRGNVARVATGCSGMCSMESTDSSSSCTGVPATNYVTDDFGNVVKIEGAGAFNAATGQRGVLRLEYDPMGNVVKQQSEAQRSDPYTPSYLSFQFDKLGRKTQMAEVWVSTTYVVSSFTYDDAESPHASCAQPLRTRGRLRKSWDPLITRWFQYDQVGRVIREIRIPNVSGNPTPSCASSQLDLVVVYSPNGNIQELDYGHGRIVKYEYGTGALTDRVQTVKTEKFLSSGTTTQTVVDMVAWEPYSGLRSYRLNFASGTGDVAYELGDATASASDCLTGPLSESVDSSGRLRSLRVSYLNGATTTELFRRTYRWTANEITRIATCYKADNSKPVIEDFTTTNSGYDVGGKLKGATGYTNYNTASTTSIGAAQYAFDSRGNITQNVINIFNHKYSNTYASTNAYAKDQLVSSVSNVSGSTYDTFIGTQFTYDEDGRTTSMYGANDSSGQPSFKTGFMYRIDNAITPGSQSAARYTWRQVAANNVSTAYWFDNLQRRQAKIYPLNSLSDLFLYNVGSNELLEDRGNTNLTTSNPTTFPIDEYIWLGGRPIAIYRAQLTKASNGVFSHGVDGSGNCNRNGVSVSCGLYFVVTDHLPKPVLTIDSSKSISGVGEYDAYGNINRVQSWLNTSHPYSQGVEGPWFWDMMQLNVGGLPVSMRMHFKLLDTDSNEGPSFWNASRTVMYAAYMGYHQGEKWTDWFPTTLSGNFRVAKLGWGTNSGNCPPSGPCTGGWNYSGFATSEFEYQRYESTYPYFPPIRFPGHYYDEETDLFENWNRNYNPAVGRYLSPEPLLQKPEVIREQAANGLSFSTYAYAYNNPLKFTDPNGEIPTLIPFSPLCARVCSDAAKEAAAKKPGSTCSPINYSMVADWVVGPNFSSYKSLGCLCSGFRKLGWDVDFWVAFRPETSPIRAPGGSQ